MSFDFPFGYLAFSEQFLPLIVSLVSSARPHPRRTEQTQVLTTGAVELILHMFWRKTVTRRELLESHNSVARNAIWSSVFSLAPTNPRC